MPGKCEVCGAELTIHNSEAFASGQQVRMRHVPTNCAQVLYSKLVAAGDALRRYGEHDGDCAASVVGSAGDTVCTCGYDAACASHVG